MNDLLGAGQGVDKLISTIEKAFGALYKPYGIRREADAEAYKLKVLESAKLQAESQGRLKLAETDAKTALITENARVELEERLDFRLKHKALQQQQNIEKVIAGAFRHVSDHVTSEDVDQDWMQSFSDHAQNVSTEQMQTLWSRLLGIEVGTPGSFSIKSLDILRKMTNREAMAFQNACKLAASNETNTPRTRILTSSIGKNWMRVSSVSEEIECHDFGLEFLEQLSLNQIGLMFESKLSSGELQKNYEFELHYANTVLHMKTKFKGARLQSYKLTPIGDELSALITPDENSIYIATLASNLSKHFKVETITASR